MLTIIRFLFGYVVFISKGPFPERFINLVTRSGIGIFNAKRIGYNFYASTMASEYKSLRPTAKKSNMKMRIKEKHGLPFIIKKYKKRLGVFIGIALASLLVYVLSLYVWSVDISGNVSISEDEINAVMYELGIGSGTLKSEADLFILEKSIMTNFNNISWLSANIKGCSLRISIKESASPPEIIPQDEPCNIVALQDAQIIRMEVYNGKAEVANGDAVLKGQLLVNSVVEDAFGGNKVTHADAKVLARTKREIRQKIDLLSKEDVPTNEIIKRKRLRIFGIELPLTLTAIPKGNYKREIEIKEIKFQGAKLPISIYEENWIQYNEIKENITFEQAKEKAENKIKEREKIELKGLKILNKEKTESITQNEYTAIVTYICEENIARQEGITIEK